MTIDGRAVAEPSPVGVDPADLRQLLVRLFGTLGTPADNAEAVADHLVEASMMGVHSHGVLRVPSYVAFVEEGRVDPAARPVVAEDRGTRVVLDGNRSFGQVAARAACDVAVTRARSGGVVVASVRGAGHLGRIGAYTSALAAAGLVGLAFCSNPPWQHNVAWYGSKVGRLGTNPVAYAFPTSTDPVVADLSTSATPEGRVRLAWNEGRAVPEGLIRDARGRPTTDPERFYAEPPGTLEPLGGADNGHKGSALALLVEVMATLLAGEAVDDHTRENNLTLVAIAPPPGFAALADSLAAHIHAAEPISAGRAVLLPGERGRQALADAGPVLVDGTTWCAIQAHAERLGVPLPEAAPTRPRPG